MRVPFSTTVVMSRIESRLKERDEARKAAVEAKRLEKEKESRVEETSEYFSEHFSSQVKATEDLLDAAKSLPVNKLAGHFNSVSENFHGLHRLVSDSSPFLAGFEIKTAQEQMTQLYAQFTSLQEQLLPKKTFSFKARPRKAPAGPKPAVGSGISQASDTERAPPPLLLLVDPNQTQFSGKEKELIAPASGEIKLRDVNLSDLRECEVRLLGTPVSLHINNLNNCCVLCGPVSSSVFVDNCKNCTFVVACQQLRVHTTVECVFYIHVTSKAIVEDSRQLKFAPYNLTYPQLQAQFQESCLNEGVNNWDQVDDFNWLVPSTPSPNWSLLPPEQRRTSWDLTTTNTNTTS